MIITEPYNKNSIRNYDEKFIQKYSESITKLKLKKTSLKKGYINKDNPIIIKDYIGKYGKGKTIEYQTKKTNNYHVIEYWTE